MKLIEALNTTNHLPLDTNDNIPTVTLPCVQWGVVSLVYRPNVETRIVIQGSGTLVIITTGPYTKLR